MTTNTNVTTNTAKAKIETRTLVELALLLAITLIMATTPLGTIPTPFLKISLVTIPVAIAAILIGPAGGLICGLTFGLTSFWAALMGTSALLSTLFVINPFGVFVTAVVARALEGILVAFIFKLLHEKLKLGKIAYFLSAICCPLLNTLLFMGCLVLFFYNSEPIQNLASGLGATNPLAFVIALVGVQGIVEAVSCLIIGGIISERLAHILHRN